MKKIYLILTIIGLLNTFNGISQQSYFKAPTGTGTTTVRGPNGTAAHAYMRGCYVVPASELCGMSTVQLINALGLNLVNGCGSTAVTGTIQVYLENTNDISYQKGNTWAAIIAPMTSVYNNAMTIPLTAGATTINLMFPSAFTYTGGGLYVAFDWYSPGAYETGLTIGNYQCATNLTFGGASQNSNSAPPASVVNTNTRPNFNFGYINTFTNEIAVQNIISHGKIPMQPSSPYSFSVVAKNQSSLTVTNVTLNLAMTGANTFNTFTTIASLPANQTVNIGFPGFTPTAQGISTIAITALNDDNNCNNTVTTTQSVTCEVLALGQPSSATNQYSLGVGYSGPGSSILMRFTPAQNSTIYAVDCGIGSDPSNIGKPVFGLLANSGGAFLAATNTLIITPAHLGKFVTFYFATPINLTGGLNYHVGLSQLAGPCFPYAVMPVSYIPPNYFYQSGQLAGFLISFTQQFGMFSFEPIFQNGITLSVNSATICSGQSVTLTANSSMNNYSWTPTASTASQIVVTPSVSTLYEVYTNSPTTCFAKKGAMVTVNITPTISVANGGICPTPGSYTFTPQGAATYTWLPTGPVDSPTATTQYTVVGSSTAGCISNVLTPSIIVTNTVNLSVISPSNGICIGKSATLTASGASSYSWTTSPGSTLNPLVVSPTIPNTYGLYGTVGTCTAFTSVFVNVNPNPTVNILPSNIVYCSSNGPTTMTATGAQTYSWNTGSTTFTAAATPTSVITYSVLGTDVNGCQDVEYFTLGPASSPTLTAAASDPTICINSNASTITVTGNATSYSWTPSTALTATNAATTVANPTTNITYTVTGYFPNNCYGTYTITQFVDPCVGVKENSGNSVKAVIYPNPNNGSFNITIGTISSDMSIEVYNIIGGLVHSQEIHDNTSLVNMTGLSNGVYLVKVKQGSQVLDAVRVIKQ